MRIISGSHKGRMIVPDKSFSARPTTDFAKENLFNVLNNRVDFEGLHVLDLFAGTGGISYEFASRGASEVVTIEMNFRHYVFIKKTAEALGFSQMKIFKTDVFVACRKLQGQKFDVVFADPPYQLEKIGEVPAAIFDNDLLTEDGLAIVEHPASVDYSSLPYFKEHRAYGSVNFSFFSK